MKMSESEGTKRVEADRPRGWSLPTAGLLEIGPGVFISTMTVEDTWRRRHDIAARMRTKDHSDTTSGK
jgi:hypothetical protein